MALSLVARAIASGQATVPATAPATMPSAAPAQVTIAAPVDSIPLTRPPANERHDAFVHLVNGKVEVIADGSSLNQILQEIGRLTRIKITGGVADEPVYGKYGPAPANQVLSTLLDGTGTNILLREATAMGPGELIVTPRTAVATPPDPNPPSSSAGYPEPNVPGARNYQRPREAWMDSTARDVRANEAAQAQPAGNTSGGAPERQNPQQIYEQLQQLQRSQQRPPQ